MRTSTQVVSAILSLSASALGLAAPRPAPASPEAAGTPTAVIQGHDPADLAAVATPAPDVADAAALSGPVTFHITNSLVGLPAVSILGSHDAGASAPVNAPIGGTFTSSTSIVVPSGWAGEFTLDKVGSTPFNTDGSRIEGNWGVNDPADLVYIDVSYVAGYSIPIVCSCGGSVVTGCNNQLFNDGTTCGDEVGSGSSNPVCINNSPTNGPPGPFFAPCQGKAYTYPNDNGAVGTCSTNTINCCLGAACPANTR
ncbi:hypothetical protein MMC20_005117 [Loxospora ochrophaea]|nr:hypothetical protein [Loxospora ochrophaea]